MISLISVLNFIQKLIYWFESGFFVDIENLGKIQNCVALPEKNTQIQVRSGLWLKESHQSFSEGNLTNIYDLHWDPKKTPFTLDILSSKETYYMADTIENDKNIIAIINGGFFFLSDIPGREPVDKRYNFCMQDGKICGLPVSDDPIVFIKKNEFHAVKTKARGICQIGKEKITWVGAKSSTKHELPDATTLYTARCFSINGIRDPKTNLIIGIPDEKTKATAQKDNVVDLVVNKTLNGDLKVTEINEGGNTHLYEGLFIIQMNKNAIKSITVGQSVIPLTIDTINLENISSGITTGRSVDDPCFYEEKRLNRRDARAVIAKDVDGKMHFFVFDGSKYIPGFKGVSAKDITPFFYPNKYEWAFFLDGGASARIIVRKPNGSLMHLANRFAYRKSKNGKILWNWKRARKIYSSIALRLV